jgi:hypothetical protein
LGKFSSAAQRFDRQIFNLRKLNEQEKQYHIEITNRFAALEILKDDEDNLPIRSFVGYDTM